jgi:WD40 repeat protein
MRDPLAFQARLLDITGRPVGGGVVVDERHVLTCAHVVVDALGDAITPVQPPQGTVEVDFLTADAAPATARVVAGGWVPPDRTGRGDVAVLELPGPLPEGVVAAPLRRVARLRGDRFEVVGFPRGSGYETGVSASGVLGGRAGPGREWVELQGVAVTGHRVERGFSGAPVYDQRVGAVVGIVVADDRVAEAKLAWMLPVATLVDYWAGLAPLVRAWAVWGPGELEGHWSPRARGVAREFQPGWYFTGRRQILRELVAWLASGVADGRVHVVTGGPGSGKSAVLARLVTLADPRVRARVPGLDRTDATVPPPGCVDVAVHARGKTLDDVVAAVALAAEVEANTAEELVDALGGRAQKCTIVVDALDEAADPAAVAGKLLRPLAAEAAGVGVRVLVGTRPGRPDAPLGATRTEVGSQGELFQALGAGAVVVDLDQPPYLERADLVEYVRRRLLLTDELAAPTPYRDRPELARRVAEAVADRAWPAFLVAQLVAGTLVTDPYPVDVAAAGWAARFPASVANAMQAYLDRFDPATRRRVRDLLTPLAYAEGAGLPRDLVWPALARALSGRRYQAEDVDWLVDTAADYLIERVEADGRLAYRLYHQALVEYLRPLEVEQAAQQRLTRALLDLVPPRPDGGRQWPLAPSYATTHLAAHAAAAGLLDELVEDPGFLLAADPARLLRMLPAASTLEGRQAAGVYRLCVHQLRDRAVEEAAAYLELTARQQHADRLAAGVERLGLAQPWSARWAAWQPATAHYLIGRHEGEVTSVAVGEVDGRPVAVSGSEDETVRVWDLHTGAPVGQPLTGHTSVVTAVAVGEVDGRPVAVTGGWDETVRVWDLRTGVPVGQPLTGHTGAVLTLAVGEVDGRPVAISAGHDRTVRVWDLRTGVPVGRPLTAHTNWIRAVAVGEVDGRPVAVTAADDTTVRVWDLRTGIPVNKRLTRHTSFVRGLTVGQVDGRPVAVTGSNDHTVRVWDLRTGAPVGQPLTGHTGAVLTLAVGEVDGRPVAVSGSEDETVRVWDLHTGAPVGQPLTGHTSTVHTVAVGEVDGRPVAVSGSNDHTVRVWDLRTGAPVGQPLTGHTSTVHTVAAGEVDGRPLAVTAGSDETVRVWDLRTGAPVGQPLTGHTYGVTAVALGEVDGRPVAVTASRDETVRVWDLRSGRLVEDLLVGYTSRVTAVAVGEVDGRPVAVTAHWDYDDSGIVVVWDLRSGEPVGDPLTGDDFTGPNTNRVSAVALGEVDGRPVAVTGGWDETVRQWDLRTHRAAGQPLTGHTYGVTAVALGEVAGRPVAVSGSWDETVRVWDLRTGAPVGQPLTGHTGGVSAVAVGEVDGRTVAVTGSSDHTVRVWDLYGGQERTIDLGAPVLALAYVQSAMIFVVTNRGLALLNLYSY